jgi:RNA polymerase sigma-70 factor (ECF subfamily)
MQKQIEEIYNKESRRVFATLVRVLGDFDFAEDALQEAFIAALKQWPEEGIPGNPRAWLVSVARFKAIDRLRRQARFDSIDVEHATQLEGLVHHDPEDQEDIEDDRLRLIFTCCHPALGADVQIALTLREVCGLSTEAIASAFLIPPATLAQRIVRGKAKILAAGIPYEVPAYEHLPERLDAVLTVIYLVFNEGYYASAGDSLIRSDLSLEAIRLGRLLLELLAEPEIMGLLALMLLHESRRLARLSPTAGDVILLEDQDRSLWDAGQIAEGKSLLEKALASRRFGGFTVQAAIAAVHANAPSAEVTDWGRIVALYDLLLRIQPSPIIELNRAIAVAMRDGAEAGLALIESLFSRGDLTHYHLAHAAHADLCRRLGRTDEARQSYRKALDIARQEPERRFLQQRLHELDVNTPD